MDIMIMFYLNAALLQSIPAMHKRHHFHFWLVIVCIVWLLFITRCIYDDLVRCSWNKPAPNDTAAIKTIDPVKNVDRCVSMSGLYLFASMIIIAIATYNKIRIGNNFNNITHTTTVSISFLWELSVPATHWHCTDVININAALQCLPKWNSNEKTKETNHK